MVSKKTVIRREERVNFLQKKLQPRNKITQITNFSSIFSGTKQNNEGKKSIEGERERKYIYEEESWRSDREVRVWDSLFYLSEGSDWQREWNSRFVLRNPKDRVFRYFVCFFFSFFFFGIDRKHKAPEFYVLNNVMRFV